MDTHTKVAPLTDLYELVCDSEKGYAEAAKKMKTPQLKTFLAKLSGERSEMKQQLAIKIHLLNPEEDLDEGTLKGNLHRTWITIREALATSTDHAVLDECARGEDYLAKRYSTVIADKETPAEALSLLREQGTKVSVTRSTISELGKTITYTT